MNNRSQVFLKQLVSLMDAVALTLAFICTYRLRQGAYLFHPLDGVIRQHLLLSLKGFDTYLWLLWIILPLWLGILHIMGAYRELRVKSFRIIIWILLKTNLLALLFFGSIVFILKLYYVSRSFMVFFFLLSFSFLALERAFLIECWHVIASRDYFHRKLLIVGTGSRARKFIRTTLAHKKWGLDLVGLVDLDPKLVGQLVDGFKIIGTLDELPLLLQQEVVDEVMFVVPRAWMSRIEKAILHCEKVGVRATVAADLFNMNFAQAHSLDFGGNPVISFETTPADEWKLAIKRLLDITVAFTGLVAISPFFLATAILIKLTSPGPVFFRQERCGVNGRRFILYKFRSMVVDAEKKLKELRHLNEVGGPVFKLTNDPRFTPIGRWLRKLSIDELPQLINVLKGEMSLVGPRPPIPQEVAQYEPWQIRRLSMRPGITGFWQVNGRSRITDFDQWVRLDLRYIDEWSLLLDMKIMLKTIPAALFGIGAK